MAYEKLKEEMYMNVGGINQITIDSATPTNDVLNLRNYGFERPGGWVSRPGYTGYVNTSLVTKITGIWDYQKLTGQSYLLVSGGNTLISYTNTTPTPIRNDLNGSPVDYMTFVNFAWGTDGGVFWRYNGSLALKWYLPPLIPPTGLSATFNSAFISTLGITAGVNYAFNLAYVNDNGSIGPVIGAATPTSDHITVSGLSLAQGLWQLWGFTVPPGYGISYMAVWLSSGVATVPPGAANALVPFSNTLTAVYLPFSLTTIGGVTTYFLGLQNYQDTGTYLTRSEFLGSSVAGIGVSYYFQQNPSMAIGGLLNGYFMEAPKYINIYNNMVVANGFSSSPSITRVSEIGQPELFSPENFFEVRTNDGDKITGDTTFQGQCLVFKEKSTHVLNGFSPDDLSLQEVTNTFGCLSNRAIVQFENRLFFLDAKGIVEFNGSNTDTVSDKIEPFFKRMNVSVARDSSCAVYLKSRNEVWFAIPIDGSLVNNAVVVYDQVVDAWTIYEGFTPYSMFTGVAGLPQENIFFGGYTGSVFAFGASLFSDNGAAISLLIQTRYHKRAGDSTQELWRRFFINNSQTSATTPITISFIPNYAGSSSLGVTVFANATFQSRVDFGLSAKSMSAQMTTSSSTEKIKILGYTIESRYLRSV